MSKRWDPTLGRFVEFPDYGPDLCADSEIWIDHQPPSLSDIPITLSDRLRVKFNFNSFRDKMDFMHDDNYFLDAGRVLPLIEALIQVAGTVEQLLNCVAEFTEDAAACAEHFQAADDKIDALKKEVGS